MQLRIMLTVLSESMIACIRSIYHTFMARLQHCRCTCAPRLLRALQGVRVGEHWKDRLDCRQWGAHFPHVAGIAGQSGQGAQSVVLSGGCSPA